MTIKTIGIIGAGTMGNGIAQTCAVAGIDAVMQDVNEAALERAMKTIGGSLDRMVRKGTLDDAGKAGSCQRRAIQAL